MLLHQEAFFPPQLKDETKNLASPLTSIRSGTFPPTDVTSNGLHLVKSRQEGTPHSKVNNLEEESLSLLLKVPSGKNKSVSICNSHAQVHSKYQTANKCGL